MFNKIKKNYLLTILINMQMWIISRDIILNVTFMYLVKILPTFLSFKYYLIK